MLRARLPRATLGSGPIRRLFNRSAGLALAALGAMAMTAQSAEPWHDKSLSPDARAEAIVRAMTLDEKIHLLHGPLGFAYAGNRHRPERETEPASSRRCRRLGIPALQLNDGPLGVRNIGGGAEGRATAFPSAQTLAASFDPGARHRKRKDHGPGGSRPRIQRTACGRQWAWSATPGTGATSSTWARIRSWRAAW